MVHIVDRASDSVPQITHICCIGAGYVGGPTSAVIASKCPEIQVTVVDHDADRIAAWNTGHSLPIYEPGLQQIVETQLHRNLHFSTDINTGIQQAQLIFIAVNTPSLPTSIKQQSHIGAATDLSALNSCIERIAQVSMGRKIIVEKSTVPCGTGERVRGMLDSLASKAEFDVLANPEFLSEGTAIRDLLYPDRVIIGGPKETQEGSQRALAAIYACWVPNERILTMDLWSAELSKLAANALLAQRISSINALSSMCESLGADITHVARACGTDSRIGSLFLKPSLGFGGSCFHKDIDCLVWLSLSLGLTQVAEYWKSILAINDFQISRFAKQITDTLSASSRCRIACLGFAYKQGTGDTRNAPAAKVCSELLSWGARLSIFDPKVPEHHIKEKLQYKVKDHESGPLRICSDLYETIDGADALVVFTPWPEFRLINWTRARQLMNPTAHVFDGQIILDHRHLRELGFFVYSVGKPAFDAMQN